LSQFLFLPHFNERRPLAGLVGGECRYHYETGAASFPFV
jgi:hypothetical protein